MRVLVLSEVGRRLASVRARIYAYAPRLRRDGCRMAILPVFHRLQINPLVDALARRVVPALVAAAAPLADVVVVHRLVPASPALAALLGRTSRRLVFDLDESLHVDHLGQPIPSRALARLHAIARHANAVIVSNQHLREYFAPHASTIAVIPTPVDIDGFREVVRRRAPDAPIVIGWIGSGGAQQYLERLVAVFTRLHERYGNRVQLRVVTTPNCAVHLDTPMAVQHVDWTLAREFAVFGDIDIGIMPLPENERSRGKAAYKALQYMAAGVPAVASPVGMNRDVIEPGVTGYLPANEEDWFETLCRVVDNPELRAQLGTCGRAYVQQHFSIDRWYPDFKAVLRGGQ